MPPTIDAQIRARIAEFADELSALVKQAAVETVQDALGGAAAPVRRRGPGRPRMTRSARRKPGRRPGRPRTAKATKATATAGKRIRRTAEDLEALAVKVHAYVRSNAGHRLEQISAGLKIASRDLVKVRVFRSTLVRVKLVHLRALGKAVTGAWKSGPEAHGKLAA